MSAKSESPTPSIDDLLEAIDLEVEVPITQPTKPKRCFLPGETRATCGADGFSELNGQAYIRKLYSNDEPRNQLAKHNVPNQHLDPSGKITSARSHHTPSQNAEWVFLGSDPHFPERWKQIHKELTEELALTKYQNALLTSLLQAQYSHWQIGGWRWDQSTAQTSGQITL